VTLAERLNQDLTAAMKARDQVRLSSLRMLKAALVNREVEKGRDLDDSEAIQVVGSLVKQRRDSIDQFSTAGRQDLVDKESAEMEILTQYQPPAASDAEIAAALDATIAETGAVQPADMGKVMKAIVPKLAGKTVDGRALSGLVRQRLSGGQA
jgi:uncharacterized protein